MCMAAPSALFPILKKGSIPFCLPVHQVRIQVKQDLGELPIVGTHGRPSAGCRRSAGCAEHSPRRWRHEVAGGDSAAALQSDLHLPGTPIYRKPRVVTPCTFSMPRCHHWRTLRTARLCTSGPKWNAFTDARVRHTGEMGACPLHKRACPLHKRSHRAAPQTFCLSLPLWPLQVTQRRPLSSCSLQWQRLPLEWAVDITEIELMDPISCPTTWPVLLNLSLIHI